MVVIFLDFDGVLHRKMSGNFEFLPNLFLLLNKYPEIAIVLSSNWKSELNEQDYKTLFGKYRRRVIGKINNHPGMIREEEILHYARSNNINKFIAIDDDCRGTLFNSNCSWLFRTDYFKGLDEESTNNLDVFIQKILYNI